ncbi:unnamed protein product [Rotaria sp. Silwood2]|nr:unnamed protein product [Rotaria sp. Silwood2]
MIFILVMDKKKKKRKQKQTTFSPLQQQNGIPILNNNSPQNGNQINNAEQHNYHHEHPSITNESTRYAQTRFPFPPYILRFKSGKVTANQVKEGIIVYGKKNYQVEIQVANCRLSNFTNNNNEYDILLFIKDVFSFSHLLDQCHWPSMFGNEIYSFPSFPSIPPQLCLLIKNVDLRLDFGEFCSDVKALYPQVKNVIRMKKKLQNNIKLVKLELTSPSARKELLNMKKITINYITYDIDEYLASATVLICSKCLAIGHFKCKQIKNTCKTCGEQYVDPKDHNCSQMDKCIRCQQNHKSNSLKCPVVKSFRAELTKKLLNLNDHTAAPGSNNNIRPFSYNTTDFPSLPTQQATTISPMMMKLDDLIMKMSEVKDHLANLALKHDKFEQFILEKNQNDERVNENINVLCKSVHELQKDVIQHSLLIERHENVFMKLLFATFENLFNVIAAQNQDNKGNPLDVDLKCKLERYRIQMKKAREGKQFIH